jgi:hypothetical protein
VPSVEELAGAPSLTALEPFTEPMSLSDQITLAAP